MKKVGRRGRTWLKVVHILFSSVWFGAALSITLVPFVNTNALDGGQLYGYNAAVKLIDDYLIIPCGIGTFITGLILCWQSAWGFFRYYWVIVTGAVTIALMVFGPVALNRWIQNSVAASKSEGLLALENQTYIHAQNNLKIFGPIQVTLIVAMVVLNATKPWGKRGAKQAPDS
jgi:uncharacterized membrane protein